VNDTLIFQHIYANTEAAEWTALAMPRLVRYCLAHQMDFQYIQADPPHPEYGKHNVGHWGVPYYLQQFTRVAYKNIIYIDHDCILADMQADLRDACQVGKIGAVWHDLSEVYAGAEGHYSVGALYVSNTANVRYFIDEWLATYPGEERWREQGTFNTLGVERDIIARIDNCWDSGHVSRSEHPVVLGFHGRPYRLKRIQEALAKLEGVTNG
jgi:hypothetical protein